MKYFLWFVEITSVVAAAVSILAQNYAGMLFYTFVAVALPVVAYRNANRPTESSVVGKTRNDAIRVFLMWDAVFAVGVLFWFAVSARYGGELPVALAFFCVAGLVVVLALTLVMWRRMPRDYVYGSPEK